MDLNVQAYRFVQEATAELSPEKERRQAASRRGGLAGGRGRANALSPEERTLIAQKANRARWASKKEPVTTG
jgi:hypothetical protein